jgi:hypothetical protein
MFGKAPENREANCENSKGSGNRDSKASYWQRLAQENRVNELDDSDHRIQGIQHTPLGILNQFDVIDYRRQEKPHHEEDFDQVLQILEKRH